ncbi:Phage protein Gp37/Gp68-like protein [uncultured Mediterranean phage uvMED]|nr:Phage protein Gp37/Gp68-like protein [uncultured Mediterranean phage uvMED]
MKNYNIPARLLSPGHTNAKTSKNEIKTFILYLAPHTQNITGVNICPKASKGCAAACLYNAGRGAFNSVQNARINKTNFYISDKPLFIKKLAGEIIKEYSKAKKKGEQIAFRLNGTSDQDFVYLLKKYAGLDITSLSPVAVFYDYTKILGKVKKYINAFNYTLTYSRAEDNEAEALEALSLGANVSAVFSDQLPTSYKGFKVVDGDTSDLVMLNHSGVILGLRAKGKKARTDSTGFVINTDLFQILNIKQDEQITATV